MIAERREEKNPVGKLFRSVMEFVHTLVRHPSNAQPRREGADLRDPNPEFRIPHPNPPSLTPEQFRRMLEETLAADPALARRVLWPLAGTVFPFVGAVCGTNASDVGFIAPDSAAKRTFGGNCGNPDFYFLGKVGIGTTSPTVLLHIVGWNAAIHLEGTGTHALKIIGDASTGRLGQDGEGFFFASDTNGKSVRFLTNNGVLNEWMRITSAGNVGIGTTDRLSRLTVKGRASFSATGTVSVTNGSTTVTGSGTKFIGEVGIGDRITIVDISQTRTVTAIASDTSLTVDAAFTSTDTSSNMTVRPSLLRCDDSSGNKKLLINDDGFLGLAGTRINDNDAVGYVVCFAEVPLVDKNNEMRGYQSTMVYTRTTADANIGGEGWDVFGYGGAIEVKDMNLPSGDPNIRGQMKPFQSELYFRPKASGAPNYNVVAPAINYVASLTAVDSTSTISQWVGVYIDSPCSECGATDKVTTGYGIWVDDLDESTHTLVKANAAAIKLSGLNEYGRILWTNCSAYCPSSGTLEFKAGTAVQTASGVNFNVGGGYRVGGTEVISSGRVADFASLKIGGTQVIDSNRGLTNLQGASVNDAASPGSGAFQLGSSFSGSPKISMNTSNGNIGTLGVVNAVNGFQFNSTPGATGTFLDQNGNTVHVNGGIITSLT